MKDNSTLPGSTDATGLFTAKNPYRPGNSPIATAFKRFEQEHPTLFCYNENNELVKGVEGLEVKGPVWQAFTIADEKNDDWDWFNCLFPHGEYAQHGIETRQVYIAVQPMEKAAVSISKGGLPDRKAVESDKYTYFKIEFKNCSMPYDYTICPEHEIQAQMTDAISSFDGWDLFGEEKPEIIISPFIMSHEEYDKWFKDNVEDNA